MKLNKTQIAFGVVLLLLIVTTSYMVVEKSAEYKESKSLELNQTLNQSYNDGYNMGIEYWNKEVINDMIQLDVVPYWINNSRYFVNLTLLIKENCEIKNG